MRSQRNVISRSLAVTLVIFLLSVIGAFAFGSADAAGCRVRPRKPAVNSNIFRQPRSLAAENAVAGSEKLSKSRIRIFFSKLNPSSGRRDGRWKAGESKANLPARLLFSYVGPLLDLASQRTLTEKDSFEVSENRKVQNSVDTLADIYDKSRRKSQKRIEEQRQKGSNAMKKSQSFLLLVSLIKHQRKELLTTGIQRLINTAVQAFPPILVARLLRFIEAADSVPLSTSLSSALLLFSVLNLKMITENQFFNNVVNMSTITRGSLEGLIFDKSLRLPGGGSNVLTAHNIGEKEKALGSGGVLNLMQSDASIIESAAMQIHTIWDGPLQVKIYRSR